MKNYLLFDLDGTLTDPREGICTCVQYALASFGIQEPDLDKLEPFIGPPLKDSFMKFYGMDEGQAEAAVAKYRERFQDTGIFENRIYEGIPEMLRALNSKGMFMAVASSKPTVYVERILEHFQIAKYFRAVVGSELDGTRTGKDEVVMEALRQLFGDKPVEKDKVYMIGDRRFDVEGAHAGGVEAVGVTYGYGGMEELKEARADYIVRSVEELQKFLLRGTEEGRKMSAGQRIWQIVLPFLLFIMVRNVVVNLAVMLLAAVGNSMAGGAFLFIRDGQGTLTGMTGNAASLVSAVGFLAGAAAILKIAGKTIGRTAEDMKLLHIREEPPRNYVLMGTATLGLVFGVNLLLELLGAIEASETYQAVAESQHAAWLPVGLFCYGVITAISEELLFRGVIYNCFRRYMKVSAAMVMSAALFAVYHGNSVQGLYAFAMGCLMVYAYEYFGDFRMPVLIHMAANMLAYVMAYVEIPQSAYWPVCIAGLVCGSGSILYLHKEKKVL